MAQWVQELHFPQLDIPIIIDKVEPILSNSNIPANNDSLYLSNLDDMVGVRVFTPTVYFYQSKGLKSRLESVVQILKDALRRVLVPYYPFTGRLRETKNGKLEVFFGPDQGALLVEAHSDVALADLGDLSVPNPAWIKLIYRFPNEEEYKVVDMPLVIAQVTKFSCGGLSLGLRICHCLCDGLGAMQFLSAWAETAKAGSLVVNPKPCWDREIFLPRDPPKIAFSHTEFKRIDEGSTLTMNLWQGKPVQKCYRISREFQAHLKKAVQTYGEFSCTTFDAMAAHVWRSWVKALDVKPLDYELRLTFSVNARAKLKNPRLNDGFYGNALPKRLEFGGKLTVTQWTRFAIYESADFGWGKPIYAGPIDLTPTPQVCVFLPEGGETEASGAMVLCICLPECACHRFRELLLSHGFK
ncbi:UNVERIFIED_CONTAM: Taxadien-5-alpha-ol O-acetyltransferase [Sesamum calycinum]|uniref:Taxadien-5-alpha-ol O-acetyltransferase n=1 Tax=Sesamum calycinum TaxID=2727403 RepID=A0AAW2IU06_9LAMI